MFVEEIIPQPISDAHLENEILLAEEQMQKMTFIKKEKAESILMGILMKKLRGRISARKVSQKVSLLQKDLKNVK